jgi:hypothetical protein
VRQPQEPVAERLWKDERPVHQWAESMRRLRAQLYAKDAELSRELDVAIQRLEFAAADLACIGHGDPTTPAAGAPAKEVLSYLFKRWPERAHEFRRLITRADQVLGRRAVLAMLKARASDVES